MTTRKRLIVLILGIIFFSFPVFGLAATQGVSVTIQVPGTTTEPTEPIEHSWAPSSPPATVVFKGKTFPSAFVVILKNGAVAAAFSAEPSGIFEKTLTGIPEGTYPFGIFVEDMQGRKTPTQNFIISLIRDSITVVSKIFISPTIDVSSASVEEGDSLNIFGQSFPGSRVGIFFPVEQISKEAVALPDGKWTIKLSASELGKGSKEVRAKAFFDEGDQSPFSQSIPFSIVERTKKCRGSDLNLDGKINLVDFSILLYYWNKNYPKNTCADANSDNIVDLSDFSIMMYYWTK